MHLRSRKNTLPILRAWLLCVLACAGSVPAPAADALSDPRGQTRLAAASPAFTRIVDPVLTTAGTARGDVAYISRVGGMDVYFRWSGVSYVFYRGGPSDPRRIAAVASDEGSGGLEAYRADVSFPGSNPAVRLEALDESGDLIRAYRKGSSQRMLNSFSRLIYREIYRNIDLVYRFADGALKYDFIVRPGGNPADIRIAYEGAQAPARLADGGVLLVTPFGELREQAPVVFTLPDGASTDGTLPARALVGGERSSAVAADFDIAAGELRFRIGDYDRTRTLVIDPGLLWSSFYGGGGEDWGYAIAVDAAGNAYFTGATLSASFPVQAAQQTAIAGNYDAFLVKMGANGQRIWATYFGGSDLDYGFGVAADGASVALCGWTRSANFPVLNAAQPASGGDLDAFAARFDSSGALLWSTYCGGSGEDRASDIAADGAGNLVLTGWTFSSDFPLLNATQAVNRGVSDAIVVKYSPAGALLLSTYRGGTGGDEGWDADADGGGNIHIAGRTTSIDFPVANAFQPANAGGRDGFVVKLTGAGALLWGSYLGGKDEDEALAVARDGAGNVSVTGGTSSDDFPVLNAWQDKRVAVEDAFVARFTGTGTLLWSTYYGGYSADMAEAAAADNAGNTVIAGSTGSITLPIRNAPMDKHPGDEAFIARFSPTGGLQLATYLGGLNNEGASGVATGPGGSIYLTGTTNSYNFPTASPFQGSHAGGAWDAFVLRLEDCPQAASAVALGPTTFCPGGSVTLQANAGAGLSYQWYKDWAKAGSGDQQTLAVTDSGKYYVLVTGPDGCVSTSGIIRVQMSVMRTSSRPDTVICPGSSVPVSVHVEGGKSPFTYAWSPAGTLSNPASPSPVATPDSTTTYHVIVTDSVGCTSLDSMTVIIRPLRLEAGPGLFICPGGRAQLAATIGGGNPPFTFQWLPSTGLSQSTVPDPTATPLATTSYVITVTDAIGCTRQDTVTVTVSSLAAVPSPNTTICYRDAAPLSVLASGGTPPYTYRWAPSTGLSAPNSANTSAQPVVNTVYTVTVTDAVGCAVTERTTVFVRPPMTLSITHAGALALCRGDSVLLSASDGYPSYLWSTGATTRSILVRQGGVFRVTVRDSLGCTASDSVTVDVFDVPAPVITALRPVRFCPGDSTVLDAGAGYAAYAWSTGATTRSIVVKSAGVFGVTVTNSNGCKGAAQPVTVQLKDAPVPVISGPPSACPGSIVAYAVAVRPGISSRWTIAGGSVLSGEKTDTVTVRWGAAGTGRVTLAQTADSSGCTANALLDVSITAALKPVIGPARRITLCDGGTALLDAGAGYASYAWTLPGGARDSGRTVLAARSGSYLLLVRDAGGCEGRDTAVVTVRPPLVPVIVADPAPALCDGDSTVLRTSVPYVSYRWSTGDTTAAIVARGAMTVSVSVTDDIGCRGVSAPLSIDVRSKPRASFTGSQVACAGTDAMYTVDAPAPGHSFAWSVTGGTAVTAPDAAAFGVRWGNGSEGVVTLRETVDSSGCFSSRADTVRIHTPPAPIVMIIGGTAFCDGDSVRLYLPGAFRSIRWNTGDSVRSIVVRGAGAFSAQVVDSNGCTGYSDTVSVTVKPAPAASIAGPASVCVDAVTSYSTAATGLLRFAWTVSGGAVVSGAGTAAIQVRWSSQGNGEVRLTVSDDTSGCSVTVTLPVAVGTSLRPRVSADGPLPRCAGDTIILRADAGYTFYEWRDGSGAPIGSAAELRVTTSGAYTVFVRDASGCSGASDTLLVNFHPLPMPVIVGPDAICPGDTAVLDAGSGYAVYEWKDAGSTSLGNARFLRVSTAGAFTVQVMDANGCTNSSVLHLVTLFPNPTIPLITKLGDTLTSSDARAWQWYMNNVAIPGATGRTLLPLNNGSYTVRTTDANGCTALSDPVDVTKTTSIQTTVDVPALRAAPGGTVRIPIRLASQSNIAALSPRDFTAELRFNKNLLFPTGSTPAGNIQGSERVIPFSGSYSDTQTPLSELTFTAMLGDSDRTALRLVNFVWADPKASVTAVDGSFLLDICREGGDRLFDGGVRFGVTAHPNPFNSSTVIDYTLVESGPAQLLVLDALGRQVAVLIDEKRQAGVGRVLFDASSLASGVYHVLLTTPGMTATTVLLLAK